MLVYEAIAEQFRALEVEALFGVPASETMRVAVEAGRRNIPHYSARHEQVAVGMADGYARVTGRVGVVLTGRGPGLTNGVNALITAAKARTPILVVAGENSNALAADPEAAAKHIMSVKTIDQVAFLESVGVVPVTLSSGRSAVADFVAAFEHARQGHAVAVLVRGDIASAEAGSGTPLVALPAAVRAGPGQPNPGDISLVADLLAETWAVRRPLVLAGRGAVEAGASRDLVRIADAIGAVLGTTLAAKGLFAGHPFDIGVVGMLSTPLASELTTRSDLVLAFGASLNEYTTFGGDLFREVQVVQVDSRPEALGRHRPVDIGVVADAGLAAARVADELERRRHVAAGCRTSQLAGQLASFRYEDVIPDEGRPGALDPRHVALALERALPSDKAVVFDNGAHISIAAKFLSPADPASFLLTHDYGSVGSGMGIALGAAVARGDRTTLLTIGDGGFMMTAADVDTAVRYRLPVVIAIFNDRALAAEAHQLQIDGFPDDFARFDNPPLDEVARSLGASAFAVAEYGALEELSERVAAVNGPLVLDCRTTMDVRGDHVELVKRLGHVHPVSC
jgi:thiamine pyrophosphate-dependent acetolactate synthase large subunit-like protein